MNENKTWLRRGMRDGMPIAMGYFAVSFSLGIAARNAGLSAFQAMLASLLNNASAGEFAAFTLIGAGAAYWEVALMTLIANARYLLMSCALSQKFDSKTSLASRMIVGFDVTDEIFGVCVSVPGKLNPYYAYGAMILALPGWAIGTYLGVLLGNALPARLVSALSVALYGMFVAIVIPPARKNRVLLGLVAVSMGLSALFTLAPMFAFISEGARVIVLTVAISAAAAVLFPIPEGRDA